MSPDPRVTPVNDRVVAQSLADRFPDRMAVAPVRHKIARPVADLSLSPGGARARQMLYGHPFDLLETRNDWSFGIAPSISYVGWVETAALAPAMEGPDSALRVVRARQTHAYAAPDMKSPERMALPHHAVLVTGAREGRFVQTDAGWVPAPHLDSPPADPVETAMGYLGAPYLWGGNSCWGIDCSGLVQSAFFGRGFAVPGDSDQQRQGLGRAMAAQTALARGDLLFWKGHVAIAVSPDAILHANAYHMATVIEPVAEAMARILAQGDGDLLSHRRVTARAPAT